jgi:chorismate mutase/prephenate dehydratase
MTLAELRQAIDRCDVRIVELLNERTRHVLNIGELKRAEGQEIYAPHRERAVLQRICRLNEGPITDDSLRHIYREIMSSALALEKQMVIAYFGPEATFTHQAAIRRFGSSVGYTPMKTIGDVFTEVSKSRAEYGVVPVENSTEGVVTHTLDMFVDSDLKIVAQIILPIQHCLLGRVKRRDAVRRLYSHPQALAQCRQWVQVHLPGAEVIEASSTTRAAELAARSRTAAAIASSLAAERYGLRILDADIQDNSANATRFLVLGRQCGAPTGKDRTSLMFSVVDEVGSLHRALTPLSKHQVNMTRIESRPSKRKAWAYFFFVDVKGHYEDPAVSKAFKELSRHCSFVKVLGSYPEETP